MMKIKKIKANKIEELYELTGDLFFDGNYEEGKDYVKLFDLDLKHSVYLEHNDKLVGAMLMIKNGIDFYSNNLFSKKYPKANQILQQKNGITGCILGLLPKYRKHGLSDKLVKVMFDLCKSYDYIMIPIDNKLNTHTYWKRHGAQLVFNDGQNSYYVIFIDKSVSTN